MTIECDLGLSVVIGTAVEILEPNRTPKRLQEFLLAF
jgi:hypothetical protein